MKSKKIGKKKTDGAIYYTGRVPMRFINHIPPNYIWNDKSFQVMAHELLHRHAPMQNLRYYIHQTGARYLVPKRSPVQVQRRSPVPMPRRSPVQVQRRSHVPMQRRYQQQTQSPQFKRAIDDYLRYQQKLKDKKNK